MAKPTGNLPTWTPPIKPYLLQRLYEKDAQGIYDKELLEEVGWGLYSRCKSFVEAMEATQGRARCPDCEGIVLHGRQTREILRCPACGWACTWRDYVKTIQKQQLSGGPEVIALFQEYMDHFPKAVKPADQMLLIDQLIHGFHHFLSSGRTRRPVGVNLITGGLEFVNQFLDQLTYGPGSTPGLVENRQKWRGNLGRR